MDVILQQDFPSLGYVGDRVKVKPGYARNFLIPRNVAVEASTTNETLLKHRLTAINAKKVKLRAQAQHLAEKMQGLKLAFTLRVGAGGRSFGSISAREVEAALKKEGYELDKRQIRLFEPIRKIGEHKVQVKLHSEVIAQVPVIVTADMPEKKADAEGSEAKPTEKRRGRKSKAKTDDAANDAAQATEATDKADA